MANKIQLMRGTKGQLTTKGGLNLAEPGYCTDTKDLYIGNASGGDTLFLAADNIPFNVYRQAIINGNFDIWERGSTVLSGGGGSNAYGYGPDRWWSQIYSDSVGGSSGNWVRQDFTVGQTVVPNNPKYFARFNILTLPTVQTNSLIRIQQPIEDVSLLSGKKVSISFWAKTGVARSIVPAMIQNFGTGGSAEVSIVGNVSSMSITTGWEMFTVKFVIPSILGKTIGVGSYTAFTLIINKQSNAVISTPSGVVGNWATGYLDVAQVQLNVGDVALPFHPRHIADEIALCSRYYIRKTGRLVGYKGTGGSIKRSFYYDPFTVRMRTVPTITTLTSEVTTEWEGVANYGAPNAIGGTAALDGVALEIHDADYPDPSTATVGMTLIGSRSYDAEL